MFVDDIGGYNDEREGGIMRSAPATWFCIKGVCVEGLRDARRWLGLRVGSAERERKGIRRYGREREKKKGRRKKKGKRRINQ